MAHPDRSALDLANTGPVLLQTLQSRSLKMKGHIL